MRGSIRAWLDIPSQLRTILSNQETLMSNQDRVLVVTEKLRKQNETEIALANAAAQRQANLQAAFDAFKAEAAASAVDSALLDDLEKAVGEGDKTAADLAKLADPKEETPAPGDVSAEPAPGVDPVTEIPAPAETETPGVPTPGGEGEVPTDSGTVTDGTTPVQTAPGVPNEIPGNPASPETDASGTIPSGTPIPGATEPSTVPEREEAPEIPTDADGNDRTEVDGLPSGVVDNSDGFLGTAEGQSPSQAADGTSPSSDSGSSSN